MIPLNILKENQYFYYNDVYIKELTKCDKLEGIDFKSIYATICFSAGITTSGELYAWGLYRVDVNINLINLEKPCLVKSETKLPVLVDYVTIFNILFAIGRILENGNYVKKVFYLEKNINNDLDYYYLKEFKDIKIEDKDSINVPMKIFVGYEKIYVLYVNGNNLLKEIEEVNKKEEINQIIECEIIQNNHIQSKKEENNIEKIKEIYNSEKLNKFIYKLNTLSDKIIKKFVKEMNEINAPNIEYDKFIENLKGKNEMLDLLLLFKGDEKENFEGKILFKYLKYRISLVEKWLQKFIYANIELNSKVFLQQIISNNIIFLPENIRIEYFNILLSELINDIYEKRQLHNIYNEREIIKVDRFKANNFYDKYNENIDKTPDIELKETIFGQIFSHYKKKEGKNFILKRSDRLFSIDLVGEKAIDEGGPYHEIISCMCNELQSEYLDLFIKTPNNKNNLGQLRDKYIINPNSNQNIHKEAYEFIGKLMALAISSGEVLNLNLHPLIWKKILENEIYFEEYETIDYIFYNLINTIEEGLKKKDQKLINSFDLNFVIKNSNESNIELIENGNSTKVNLENLEKFIILAKEKRLNEFDIQINHIKKGFHSAIEKNVIQILSYEQFEELICGENKLDVLDFKNHTEYYGYQGEDNIIKWFWEWLENAKEDEKFKYLKFVSGRTRLPKSGFGFEFRHIITKVNAENSFPTAATCFFTLKLPNYKSKEVLIEKIKYVIENCTDINDFN